jgi:hypothetical protein
LGKLLCASRSISFGSVGIGAVNPALLVDDNQHLAYFSSFAVLDIRAAASW